MTEHYYFLLRNQMDIWLRGGEKRWYNLVKYLTVLIYKNMGEQIYGAF